MGQGRRTSGPKLVDKMHGDKGAKKRLHVMLQTITGELTIPQACALLEIGEAHFHRLRDRALQAAVDALAPQPLGRPGAVADPLQQRVAQLEQEKRGLELQLRAAQVREEIAQVMPHLLRPLAQAQKKTPRPMKRKLRPR